MDQDRPGLVPSADTDYTDMILGLNIKNYCFLARIGNFQHCVYLHCVFTELGYSESRATVLRVGNCFEVHKCVLKCINRTCCSS